MKNFNEWMNENFESKSFKVVLIDQNGSVVDELEIEVDDAKYINIIASNQQDPRADGSFAVGQI